MIVHVWQCARCGPMPTAMYCAGDLTAYCPRCEQPLAQLFVNVDTSAYDDPQAAPPPGAGGARDGGVPWPDPFDGLLCGVRFLRAEGSADVPVQDGTVHWQVYVIDPSLSVGDDRRMHVAATTVCGVAGPYQRPNLLVDACQPCHDGFAEALAEARVVFRCLQDGGRAGQ
jgi:hypothetical protein